jgi:hypothetical protein
MIDTTIEAELSSYLDKMPIEQQRKVLEFARTLATRSPRGVPGKSLVRFAGTIEKSDLELMEQAIEEGQQR